MLFSCRYPYVQICTIVWILSVHTQIIDSVLSLYTMYMDTQMYCTFNIILIIVYLNMRLQTILTHVSLLHGSSFTCWIHYKWFKWKCSFSVKITPVSIPLYVWDVMDFRFSLMWGLGLGTFGVMFEGTFYYRFSMQIFHGSKCGSFSNTFPKSTFCDLITGFPFG